MKGTYSQTFKVAEYCSETIGLEYDSGEIEMSAPEMLQLLTDAVYAQYDKNREFRKTYKPEFVSAPTVASKGTPPPAARQQSLPNGTYKAPVPAAPGARAPNHGRIAKGMSKPYTIKLPYAKGAAIDVDAAKTYIKSLQYWFLGKDDGGDNCWHGEVYPDQMPELEQYMTKRPASEDPVGDAMGDDDISF